jgi:hypothetical protein
MGGRIPGMSGPRVFPNGCGFVYRQVFKITNVCLHDQIARFVSYPFYLLLEGQLMSQSVTGRIGIAV